MRQAAAPCSGRLPHPGSQNNKYIIVNHPASVNNKLIKSGIYFYKYEKGICPAYPFVHSHYGQSVSAAEPVPEDVPDGADAPDWVPAACCTCAPWRTSAEIAA